MDKSGLSAIPLLFLQQLVVLELKCVLKISDYHFQEGGRRNNKETNKVINNLRMAN